MFSFHIFLKMYFNFFWDRGYSFDMFCEMFLQLIIFLRNDFVRDLASILLCFSFWCENCYSELWVRNVILSSFFNFTNSLLCCFCVVLRGVSPLCEVSWFPSPTFIWTSSIYSSVLSVQFNFDSNLIISL